MNELKFLVMVRTDEARKYVAGLEKELKPIVEEIIATLKQMVKSGKFTAEQLQTYFKESPYVTAGIKYISMLPELTNQAIIYLKANVTEAFWGGVKVAKAMWKGVIAQAKTVKSADVEKAVLDFYTEIVAKSDEIYAAVTDQWTKDNIMKIQKWTKETINEVNIFVKDLMNKMMLGALRMKIAAKAFPDTVKAYLPILKEMYRQRLAQLKTLITKYVSMVKVAAAENYAKLENFLKEAKFVETYQKLETLLKTKLETLRGLVKDTTGLAEMYVKIITESVQKFVDNIPFLDNKLWGEIVAEIKSHELYKLAMKTISEFETKVQTLAKKLIAIAQQYIKKEGPIIEAKLKAMKAEAMKRVEQVKSEGRQLYRRSVEQLEAIVAQATPTYKEVIANLEAKYITLIADMEAKYGTFIAEIYNQYENMIVEAKLKYELFVKTVQKIYEKVTIGDMVAYVNDIPWVKLSMDVKVKVEKYVEEIKAFVEEYKQIISKLDVNAQIKIVAAKVESLMKKFVDMMEPYEKVRKRFIGNVWLGFSR
jgi:hypothetical protein